MPRAEGNLQNVSHVHTAIVDRLSDESVMTLTSSNLKLNGHSGPLKISQSHIGKSLYIGE